MFTDYAFEAAQHGMRISMEAAQRNQPEFAEIAKRAILAHLRAYGASSGETLTEIAIAHGARPVNDSRAFGGVFQSLARKGLIRKVGFAPRKHGHCAPGPVWALVV